MSASCSLVENNTQPDKQTNGLSCPQDAEELLLMNGCIRKCCPLAELPQAADALEARPPPGGSSCPWLGPRCSSLLSHLPGCALQLRCGTTQHDCALVSSPPHTSFAHQKLPAVTSEVLGSLRTVRRGNRVLPRSHSLLTTRFFQLHSPFV